MTTTALTIPAIRDLPASAERVEPPVGSVWPVPGHLVGLYGQRTRAERTRRLLNRRSMRRDILRIEIEFDLAHPLTARQARHLDVDEDPPEALNAQLLIRSVLDHFLEILTSAPGPIETENAKSRPLYQLAQLCRDHPERIPRILAHYPSLRLCILPLLPEESSLLREREPKLHYIGVVRSLDDLDRHWLLGHPEIEVPFDVHAPEQNSACAPAA